MNCQNDGRSARSCSQPIYCLEDADRVRKELEKERRRMRLQQVREESKKVARKIRNNVAYEKDRQLRQLELAKAQEMENWRQSVMAQQHHDYRSAIFQVGSAHAAAQIEKERMALKECQKSNKSSTFRQQLRARRSCEMPSNQLNQQPLFSNKSRSPSATRQGVSEKGQCRSSSAEAATAAQKRKRNVGFHQCNCACQCDNKKRECPMSGSDSDEDDGSDSSCFDSSLMDTDSSSSNAQPCPARGGLSKTPTVIVDVEVCSDDSVSICTPCEIKDKHVSSNRQFSRVVRGGSPEPKPKIKTKTSMKPQPPPPPTTQPKTKTTPLKKRTCSSAPAPAPAPAAAPKPKIAATPKKKPVSACAQKAKTATTTSKKPLVTQASPKKVTENRTSPIKKPAVPRFTEVSNLLKQQNINDKKLPPSPCKKLLSPPPPPTSPRTASPSPERPCKCPTASAELQATSGPASTTTVKSNTAASSVLPNTTNTTTRITNVSTSLDSGGSSGSILCTGRVQFYDYKNKFTKEYPQPESTVHIDQCQPSEPNAMEQACIETERRQAKEKEIDTLRKKSDERGLKALERETVRRDCADLADRLDNLGKPNLPPQFLGPDPTILPAHHFADLAARRERKMNAAMEEMVLKPAVITCPVIGETQRTENAAIRVPKQQQKPQYELPRCMSAPTTLNLGTNEMFFNESVSSESCRSILLGYVNDQSQQLRHDLTECNGANQPDKTVKLKELLNRIEVLRESLVQELNKQEQANAMPNAQRNSRTTQTTARPPTATAANNVQQLMASIGDVRRQRDCLLQEQRKKESEANQAKLRRQKAECRANSTKFEEQMRTICQLLQNASNEDGKPKPTKAASPPRETMRCAETRHDKPKADKPRKRSSSQNKPPLPKTPRRLASLATLPSQTTHSAKKNRNKQRTSLLKCQRREIDKHNSYDSNSTSYRSLPPTLTNKLDAFVPPTAQPACSDSESETDEEPRAPVRVRPQDNLNPLVAQYVNRLLAMSSRSIYALGVSSSEMDTPNSSVVNTPTNQQPNNPGKCLPAAMDASWITDDRLQRVQRFIQDNRNFIHDLESTMLSEHGNVDQRMSLEMSMQAIEEIWRQRFGGDQGGANQTAKQPPATRTKQSTLPSAAAKHTETNVCKEPNKKKAPLGASNADSGQPSTDVKKKDPCKQPSKPKCTAPPAKSSAPMAPPSSRTRIPAEAKTVAKKKAQPPACRSVETQVHVSTAEEEAETEAQLARYGQLTKNCTQRIEQLNGMISKIREEKQKLLEVTLSSVSSHERNSTEYADLPHTTKGTTDTSTTSTAVSGNSGPSTSKQNPPTQSNSTENAAQPLDKQKTTGWSRDSGISESRPMTAMGDDYQSQADAEPVSSSTHSLGGLPTVTSASQHAIYHANKPRPPPTLRRFSPQLVDDELAHELSTILEVDTPVTSRLNTSIQQPEGGPAHSSTKMGQPIAFPTFEQYAQQTNLNLTQMDPEMSRMIEEEYNELIAALRDAEQLKDFSYKEFPSLNTYLQDGSSPDAQHNLDVSPDNVEELLECLRLANVTLRSFPSRKDYMSQAGAGSANKGNAAEAEDNELLDTASLENVTSCSSSDSTTMNIEEELKRRNIIQNPFRTAGRVVTSSTSRTLEDGDTKIYARVVTAESGVEKLSSSDNLTGELEKELHGIGLAWTATMRKKGKEAAALSCSSTTTPTTSSLDHLPLVPAKKRRPRHRQLDCDALALEEQEQAQEQACESHSTLIDEGRPLNLREFLTKELMKHVNTSSSSSSSCNDDSLRSQFLNSIIDSISPRHTLIPSNTATSAQNRTERQKTSTPVPSNSGEARSRGGGIGSGPLLLSSSTSITTTSSSNLFSGESRLSSVHYQDLPSMRFLSTDTTKCTTRSSKPHSK